MKIEVTDNKGKKINELDLKEAIFGLKPNNDLLAQYIYIYNTNQRQGTRAAKNRAEVSGGGRKPWKQKGTGRARHGSTRSPVWVHGGTAHAPKPKDWTLTFPKRMRKVALATALSQKFSQAKIKVIDSFDIKKPSTKSFIEILDNLKLYGKTLVVLNGIDTTTIKSAANLQYVNTTQVQNINIYEILNVDTVLFLQDSITSLQEKFK